MNKIEEAVINIWDSVLDFVGKLAEDEEIDAATFFDVNERALRCANNLDDEDTGLHMVQSHLFKKTEQTMG